MNVDISQLTNLNNKVVINKKIVPDILNALGNVLLSLIKQRAPRDKGNYVAGWRKEVKSNSVRVFNLDRELYILLEFGAKPHRITPSTATALYFDGKFYASVQHTGFDAIPHLRPALTQLKNLIPVIVKAKLALNSPILKGLTRDLYPEAKYAGGNNRGGGNNKRVNTRVKGSNQ